MKHIAIVISGILFGIGITLAGMTDPMKVLNFMDLFGAFDATLIFVMGGALLVTFIGYRLVLGRAAPTFAHTFDLPALKTIDAKLLAGAALFGLGWGLTGFCPGPAVASLVFGHVESLIFVGAMSAGMLIARNAQSAKNSDALAAE
jgi:uncharacterized membrane protein YedE/YeeE